MHFCNFILLGLFVLVSDQEPRAVSQCGEPAALTLPVVNDHLLRTALLQTFCQIQKLLPYINPHTPICERENEIKWI